MNTNLKLVRKFYQAVSVPLAEIETNLKMSEMDIIFQQALLMEEGSAIFRAIKAGDMVDILAGMINLAYVALGAIAIQGGDVIDKPVHWQHDGYIISLMRLFSDKIHHCASGSLDSYSDVYCLCVYLSRSFINANFDKAFLMVHDNKMDWISKNDVELHKNSKEVLRSTYFKTPDLSDCLYE